MSFLITQNRFRQNKAYEMGFLSQKIEKCKIVVGDHIYTWRAAYTYSHHGIFVGQNKVIHFTLELTVETSEKSFSLHSSIISSPIKSSIPCNIPDCGYKQPESGVLLSCLDCFLGTGYLYRYEYKVSRSIFLTKIRGGTCTTAESDPQESVVKRAMALLHYGFGKYHVIMNNCEDFAIYCKTGLMVLDEMPPGRSGQVASVIAIISSSLFYFLPKGIATVVTSGMYFCGRYMTDIGVRVDVVKVPVEEMGSFHGWGNKILKIN